MDATTHDLYTVLHVGVLGNVTDGQLLQRFKTGGKDAESVFSELLERHGPMVLRVCTSVLRDPHEAQDAFQATFLVLVQKKGSIQVLNSLGPWLHEVAYRVAVHARSTTVKRRMHEKKAATMATIQVCRQTEWDEYAEIIHFEIKRLPERFRAAVVLCDLEGQTEGQAARQLNWPVGTVRSRLARGREKLRSRLTRLGFSPLTRLQGAMFITGWSRIPLSTELLHTTVQSALRIARCGATAALTTQTANSLAKGVLQSMFWTSLKIPAAILVVLAAVAGSGVLARQEVDHNPPRESLGVQNASREELPPLVPSPPQDETRSVAEIRQEVEQALKNGDSVLYLWAQAKSGFTVAIYVDRPDHLDEAEPTLKIMKELGRIMMHEMDRAPKLRTRDSPAKSEVLRPTGGAPAASSSPRSISADQRLKDQNQKRDDLPKPSETSKRD